MTNRALGIALWAGALSLALLAPTAVLAQRRTTLEVVAPVDLERWRALAALPAGR